VKITGGPNFFPERPNFSSKLAEMFCKVLVAMADAGVMNCGLLKIKEVK
jgi:hypothetical protein